MKIFSCVLVLFVLALGYCKDCPSKRINSKLICYYSKLTDIDSCYCTHVVIPANSDLKFVESAKQKLAGAKILLTVTEFNQGLIETVKKNNIDGLEIKLKKLDSKSDITEFISTVRSRLGNDLYLALSVPPKTELLAKYYDLKALTKSTDLFILQTAFLGASKNVTFHPSRLSGLWDMQNTDSVVDLVIGLGAPLSKLAITAPVQAFQFKLQDTRHTTPGSPALELKSLTRDEFCTKMGSGDNWMLERDQDQAGPYMFRENQWISFEDPTSMDIKAKYARVRGLAGLALKDVSMDGGSKCGGSLLKAAYTGLSKQTRATRGAVLRSLEREILETPAKPLATVNVSPFRISRVVDVEGHVHVIRKDTRTEFTCARQGYFVHPHSCGRFYRCVKFDQLTEEFSVFEFDCPAGLAFDSRWEVCVWPGSLPHGTPCSGSSEIAPVPRERFTCPSQPGYYADPENCRWFFACLDHGKSGLTAYEFRCPFGLVYDEKRLLCEWSWLVPTCANGHAYGLESGSFEFFGGVAGQTIHSSKTIGVGVQPNLAHVFESYDGLGSLGTIQLGGYHGDLNTFGQLHGHGFGYNSGGVLDSNQYGGNLDYGGIKSEAEKSAFGYNNNGEYSIGLNQDNLHLINSGPQLDTLPNSDNFAGKIDLRYAGLKLNGEGLTSSNNNHGSLLYKSNNDFLSKQSNFGSAQNYDALNLNTKSNSADVISGFAAENLGQLSTTKGLNSQRFGSLYSGDNLKINSQLNQFGNAEHLNLGQQFSIVDSSYENSGDYDTKVVSQANVGHNIGSHLSTEHSGEKLIHSNIQPISNIQIHGNSEYNLGGNAEQITLIDSGKNLNVGEKLTLVNDGISNIHYHGHSDGINYANLGEKVTLLDSGAKLATSTIHQQHENTGNKYANFGESINLADNAQLKINNAHYLTNANTGATSSSFFTQSHANEGNNFANNAELKISNANVHYDGHSDGTNYANFGEKVTLLDSGAKLATVQLQENIGTKYTNFGDSINLADNAQLKINNANTHYLTNANTGATSTSFFTQSHANEGNNLANNAEIKISNANTQYGGHSGGINYANFGEKVTLLDSGAKLATSTVHQSQENIGNKYANFGESINIADNAQLKINNANTHYLANANTGATSSSFFTQSHANEGNNLAHNAELKISNANIHYGGTNYANFGEKVTLLDSGAKLATSTVHQQHENIGNKYANFGESINIADNAQLKINNANTHYLTNANTGATSSSFFTQSHANEGNNLANNAELKISNANTHYGGHSGGINYANFGEKVTLLDSGAKLATSTVHQQHENIGNKYANFGESINLADNAQLKINNANTHYLTNANTGATSSSYFVQSHANEGNNLANNAEYKINNNANVHYLTNNYGNTADISSSFVQSHENQRNNLANAYYLTNGYGNAAATSSSSFVQSHGNQGEHKLVYSGENSGLYKNLGASATLQNYGVYKVAPTTQYFVPQSVHKLENVATPLQNNIHFGYANTGDLYNKQATSSQHLTQSHASSHSTYNKNINSASNIKYDVPISTSYGLINQYPAIQQYQINPIHANLSYATQYFSVTPKSKLTEIKLDNSQYKTLHASSYQSPIAYNTFLDTENIRSQDYGKQLYQNIHINSQVPVLQEQIVVSPKYESVTIAPKYVSTNVKQGKSFQSISFGTKVPIIEKQQVIIPTTYQTQYHQNVNFESKTPILHQEQVYVAPKIESVSVTPKYQSEYGSQGSSFQSIATNIHQPQVVSRVETIAVTPKYENQYNSNVHSYQNVAFETKTPIVEHKQIYVAPKIETISVTPQYDVHYHEKEGSSFQNVAFGSKTPFIAPKIETLSVTPNYEQGSISSQNIHTPIVHQQINIHPQIETVTPKYDTQYYEKQSTSFAHINNPIEKHVYVQPKIETVSVTPQYETQYYEKQTNIHTPIVQQTYVKNVKTVSALPKFESYQFGNENHGSSFQTVSYKHKTPVVQQQIYVQPKLETVSVTPKYETHYYSRQENILPTVTPYFETYSEVPNIYQKNIQEIPLKTVISTPSIVESYRYEPQKTILKQQSREYLPAQLPETVYVASTPKSYATSNIKQEKIEYHSKQEHIPVQTFTSSPVVYESYSFQPQQSVTSLKSVPFKETVYVSSTAKPYIAPPTPKYDIIQEYNQPQFETRFVSTTAKPYIAPKVYVSSTPKYNVFQEYIQPKVVSSFTISTPKPYIAPKIAQTYVSTTPKYIYQENVQSIPYVAPKVSQVYVSSTPKYNIFEEFSQPKIESSYAVSTFRPYIAPKVSQVVSAPKYTSFQEVVQPKQPTYVVSTPKPYVVSTPKPFVDQNIQFYNEPSTSKYNIQQDIVVSTARPFVSKTEQIYVSSTPKYNVFQEYVAPKQTLVVQPKVITEFKYENAAYQKNNQNYQLKQETYKETLPKTQETYVNDNFDAFEYFENYKQGEIELPKIQINQNYDESSFNHEFNENYKYTEQPKLKQEIYYSTQKPIVSTGSFDYKFTENVYTQQPKIKEETIYYSTPKPATERFIPLKNYQTDYIISTPKPTFISTIVPVIKQTARLPTKVVAINKYIVTTPQPVYIASTTPLLKTVNAPTSSLTFYDSRFDTAEKTSDEYFNEYENTQYNNDYDIGYTVSTAAPKIVSTAKPIVSRKKIVTSTTAIPLGEFYDSRFVSTEAPEQYLKETVFEKYNDASYVTSPKPRPTIRPVVIKKKLITSTTPLPEEYFDSSYVTSEKYATEFDDVEKYGHFESDYLVPTSKVTLRPIVRKKIVTTTAVPYIDEEYISTRRPISVKITPKPKGKAIVRVNDFHPFLTTKLGAQCTCASNTVQLRRKSNKNTETGFNYDNLPVTKLTSDGPASHDDYNEPGVYVVANSDNEAFEYESSKLLSTLEPEVVVSTTNAAQPAPTPIYTIKKKATSVTPLEINSVTPYPDIIYSTAKTSADEVFLRKSSRKNNRSKEEKIAEAVKEGLTLVKSAIKGYVKEAIVESVRDYDRFGPGGWRSRDETLQGTQDCQREGLFRHPTQCNKFYACHWDCTKERYTLHVFNCPVHLTFDNTMGACNWPSKGPACSGNTLLPTA